MTTVSAQQLSQGLMIVCDGGARNNQNPSMRQAYGSFAVIRDGARVASTYRDENCLQHHFVYDRETNSYAEVMTLIHTLRYIKELVGRGYNQGVRLCLDSQNAILAATTDIKKPAEHLRALYAEARQLTLELKWSVQIVKFHESQVKQILGH